MIEIGEIRFITQGEMSAPTERMPWAPCRPGGTAPAQALERVTVAGGEVDGFPHRN